jgi:hypothetical protein
MNCLQENTSLRQSITKGTEKDCIILLSGKTSEQVGMLSFQSMLRMKKRFM